MEKTMITSLAWVAKGFAKSIPLEYDINQQDVEEMKNDPIIQEEFIKMLKITDLLNIRLEKNDKRDILEMEHYDEESSLPVFSTEAEKYKINQKSANNDDYPMGFEDVSDDEKEDYAIQKDDILIVAAKIEEEFSSLEIYVYEPLKCNLYVHHEITLSAFPLCVEWLPIEFSSYTEEKCKKGNFAIVGSFLPEIEIWDLDVVNAIEPTLILGLKGGEIHFLLNFKGGEIEQNKKKAQKFNNKKKNFKKGSHEDAVICLSVNKFRKNLLCSGSADTSVKLWDLTANSCMHTYELHKNKVQVVKWNPAEDPILFSCGFDKKLHFLDVRQATPAMTFDMKSDIESGVWDPLNPMNVVFSTEDGCFAQIDARNLNFGHVFHTRGHEKSTTSVSVSPHANGMIITTSLDGKMKIWDATQITNGEPKLIANKMAKAGKLYCGSFCEDTPWLFSCGSASSDLVIWDTIEDQNVKLTFEGRVAPIKEKTKKKKKGMELEEIKQ